MVDAPAVIDLGLDRDAPAPKRPPGHLWSPPVRRRWALAGCLALILATVAGANPPPPALVLVDPAPPSRTTGFSLVGDELYVMTGGRESRLFVYDLPDGRMRWSTPASPADIVQTWRTGDTTLVLSQQTRNSCCELAAYGSADGELRWARSGSVVGIGTEDELVVLAASGATQVVDIGTGRILWQVGEPVAWQGTGPGYLLLIYPGGVAERRELRTGAVQVTGRIYEPSDQLGALDIVGGRLVVEYRRDYQLSTVTAYDVDDFDLAWTRSGLQVDGLVGCGLVVCLHTSGGLQAVEPGTGQVSWFEDGWYGLELGQRLLAVTTGLREPRVVSLVDPWTGSVLLDLRSWQVHLDDGGGTRLVLTRTPAGTARTTVALADLETLSVQVLGVIPGRATECQAGAKNLACRTADGRFQLWAYRS